MCVLLFITIIIIIIISIIITIFIIIIITIFIIFIIVHHYYYSEGRGWPLTSAGRENDAHRVLRGTLFRGPLVISLYVMI